jgi:hypothetical protein
MPRLKPPQDNKELEDLKFAYLRTFSGEAGKAVLKDLQDMYEGSAMVKSDPYSTAYNVGCQDVVKAIRAMVTLSLEEEHNAD